LKELLESYDKDNRLIYDGSSSKKQVTKESSMKERISNYLRVSRASQTVDDDPQPSLAFSSYLQFSKSPGFAG
jgi:predicted transcriptional regulator